MRDKRRSELRVWCKEQSKTKQKKKNKGQNLPIYFDTALCTVRRLHKSISPLKSILRTEQFFFLHAQQMEPFQWNDISLMSTCTGMIRK